MEKNHRRCLIVGNWKMNTTSSEAVELAQVVKNAVGVLTEISVVVCPPFTALERVARVIEDSNVQLGAQNMHQEPSGAFTGEISAGMLRSLFCRFVILGHSERRIYFDESDSFVNQKTLAALRSNLKPILCVGETIEEHKSGRTMEIVERQLRGGLANIPIEFAQTLVIAYEPVWAIGTGETATPETAGAVHREIRNILLARFNRQVASGIRILYGGSVNPGNVSQLLDEPDIDGGLIGGASLDAKSFVQIVETAHAKI